MNFDAFISYASKDKPTADAVCAALEDAQIRCWIAPRDILPGTDWSASIIDALDHCRVMILIFSGNANESPQIRNEVVHAVHRGVPVIPVRIEDIPPGKSLAYFMSGVHWLDALSPPLETHLKRLAESVRAILQLVPAAELSAGMAPARATGSKEEVIAFSSAGPQPGVASFRLPPASTRHRENGAPPAAALWGRAGAALVGAVSAGFLIACAAIYYFGPAWELWFQPKPAPSAVAMKSPPAGPQLVAESAPLRQQLLAKLAVALPSLSPQSREQRVRDYVQAKEHKAQAISLQPPGTWRATGRADAQMAQEAALENCQIFHGQPCALIAINDAVLPAAEGGNWPSRDMPRVRYAGNFDPNQIPGVAHLRQRVDIAGYAAAAGPKAVAYHPASRIFVVTHADSQRTAEETVLDLCNSDPARNPAEGLCFLYAVGNQVVLPQRLRKPQS
jgi:TIR domain-containing protein